MWLLVAQLAETAAGRAPPPDIEFRAQVRARELTIEQQGRASARVHAQPSGGERIEVERNLPKGQAQYRNLALTVQIDARLAEALGEVAPAPPSSRPDQSTTEGD
jgi:hypothetical protein